MKCEVDHSEYPKVIIATFMDKFQAKEKLNKFKKQLDVSRFVIFQEVVFSIVLE